MKIIEILQMFKKELDASNEITELKSNPHVRINFCSKHMCNALINIGCGHNKTYFLSLKFKSNTNMILYVALWMETGVFV